MDIQLPDIDGTTVLARIREDTSLDAMPVLAVSASVMPDEQQRIVGSGFDGFIAKPISIKPFLAAVQRALTEGRPEVTSPHPGGRRRREKRAPAGRRVDRPRLPHQHGGIGRGGAGVDRSAIRPTWCCST